MNNVLFYGITDLGKVRDNNEDAFVVQKIWDDNHVLAVVIDGVGGNEGGEVAAEIAKTSIVEYLQKYCNGERVELLKQAVVFANNAILDERRKQLQYANMSCVLTAVLVEVDKRRLNMVHVGDTRLYQYTADSLVKLSHDHSMVGYREEIGDLTEIEAMTHPQRNIISKDVGSELLDNNTDYVETAVFDLYNHPSLLLCSDGLCDMITSSHIKRILDENLSVEEKVGKLITAANDAGGKDNVTVVLLDCEFEDSTENVTADSFENKVITTTEEHSDDDVVVNQKGNTKIVLLFVLTALLSFVIGFFVGGYFGKDILPYSSNDTTIILDTTIKTDTVVYDSINWNAINKQ